MRLFIAVPLPKDVQKKASCVIPSNNDRGVIMTLKKLFEIIFDSLAHFIDVKNES